MIVNSRPRCIDRARGLHREADRYRAERPEIHLQRFVGTNVEWRGKQPTVRPGPHLRVVDGLGTKPQILHCASADVQQRYPAGPRLEPSLDVLAHHTGDVPAAPTGGSHTARIRPPDPHAGVVGQPGQGPAAQLRLAWQLQQHQPYRPREGHSALGQVWREGWAGRKVFCARCQALACDPAVHSALELEIVPGTGGLIERVRPVHTPHSQALSSAQAETTAAARLRRADTLRRCAAAGARACLAEWLLDCPTACRPNPLYEAPDVHKYLQHQRQRHVSLAAGSICITSEYLPSAPAPAPDLSKCAVALAQLTRLVLLELPAQRELGRWLLPSLSIRPSNWCWDASGTYLAVPWGRAWSDHVFGDPAGLQPGPCGLSIVDTVSGSTASAELGFQQVDAPVLGSWSPCGLLIVRHQRQGEFAWTLFTPAGSIAHTLTWRQLFASEQQSSRPAAYIFADETTAFAPVGSRVLLSVCPVGRQQLHVIWSWQALAVLLLPPTESPSLCWSPDGQQLLAAECMDGGLTSFHSSEAVCLASQQLPVAWHLAWAVSDVVAIRHEVCVTLYTVQKGGPVLVPLHSFGYAANSVGLYRCLLAFSPDGMHLALCAAWHEREALEVAFLTTQGRLLGVHQLTIDATKLPSSLHKLAPSSCVWSSTGTCLAVGYECCYSPERCISLLNIG